MADKSELEEPDALPGAPHPRERAVLFGHRDAEQAFLEAFACGRMHHAWLIGGPEGIGKATFAYRAAKFALEHGGKPPAAAEDLAIDAESRTARQVAALSHPNLVVLRRTPATDKKAASTTIPVDSVRKALSLFGSTAADSGYRVCVVDSAEDLTGPSANALLKMVEEPPPRSLFFIISHAPQRVLPTIRSRCRRLLLRPLGGGDLARAIRSLDEPFASHAESDVTRAISHADGSVRRAIEMLDPRKVETVENVATLLDGLPRVDLKRVHALAERLARKGNEPEFGLALEAVERWISETMNARATFGAARLAPLLAVCEKITRAAREADIYNLDRRPLVLTLFGDLAEAVRALR